MGKKATLKLKKANAKAEVRKRSSGKTNVEHHKVGKPKKRRRGEDGGMHKNDVEVERYEKVISLKKPKKLSKSDQASVVDRKGATIKKHRSELQSLEEDDPEFFDYLRKSDKSLLEFGGDDDDDDDEDEDEDEDDDMSGVHVEDNGDLEGMEFGNGNDSDSDMEGEDADDLDLDDDDDDDNESDSASGSKSKSKSKSSRSSIQVTLALLKETSDRACEGSIPSLKK